ncbi:MAG: FkbM family methyltransferase [Bryobacteraceae bacterium]
MRFFHKLRRIVKSDLARADVFWYLLDEVLERAGMQTSERSYRLRDGSTVFLRQGTTDGKVFEEVFIDEIYAPFVRKAAVLVDLGANVGLSTLFLSRRIGFDQVVAVEPDFENLQALRRNLDDNLSVPCESMQAFAGAERGFAKVMDAGYGAWGLRMGESAASGIEVLPLAEIIPRGSGDVLLKCDIEGAERFLFPQIDTWDHLVSFVILELHTEFFTMEQLRAALRTSRYLWKIHGEVPEGAVLAVFGLERGALQSESDSRNYSRGAAAV